MELTVSEMVDLQNRSYFVGVLQEQKKSECALALKQQEIDKLKEKAETAYHLGNDLHDAISMLEESEKRIKSYLKMQSTLDKRIAELEKDAKVWRDAAEDMAKKVDCYLHELETERNNSDKQAEEIKIYEEYALVLSTMMDRLWNLQGKTE